MFLLEREKDISFCRILKNPNQCAVSRFPIHIFLLAGDTMPMEVREMAKNGGKNRGTKAPGVNPQGFGQDATLTPDPKSKLEDAAKRSNTK
jgi:small acid-soluble spore protein L (minor)